VKFHENITFNVHASKLEKLTVGNQCFDHTFRAALLSVISLVTQQQQQQQQKQQQPALGIWTCCSNWFCKDEEHSVHWQRL